MSDVVIARAAAQNRQSQSADEGMKANSRKLALTVQAN
jgi:hypothetical protein